MKRTDSKVGSPAQHSAFPEISGQRGAVQAYNSPMDAETYARSGDGPAICRVAVYAASSDALDGAYLDAAGRLGSTLARAGMRIVYGGGGTGLMGAMADGALGAGAEVAGVVPRVLLGLELSHPGLSRLDVVEDMRERKQRMLSKADAVVALPGGCGTFEELLEAMTLKRLGIWTGPIVLVNTRRYYDRFVDFLAHSVAERFMDERHSALWSVVDEPEQVPEAFRCAPPWDSAALQFASVGRSGGTP